MLKLGISFTSQLVLFKGLISLSIPSPTTRKMSGKILNSSISKGKPNDPILRPKISLIPGDLFSAPENSILIRE
jgi:hypothetical protein